jgi:hypothetical protein
VTSDYRAIGATLTIVALYVRLMGRESEPSDGMLLGALTGAAAAFPLVFIGGNECLRFAECVIGATIAGYGITFAAFYVRRKGRQIAIDVLTALAAVGGAAAAHLSSVDPRELAIGTAIAIPVVGLATVFKQWRDVRHELAHEAALGFIDPEDVRVAAHPFRRFGGAGWADPRARREFVRLANRIALRKRQQRNRSEEEARLYQLEIMKLRMQLQDMSRIDHEVSTSSRADTMTEPKV